MNQQNKPPKIIVPAESEPQQSGSWDCNCDCACSLQNELNPHPLHATPPHHRYRAKFHHIRLTDDYSVCYNPPYSQPVVLNRPALDLLARFKEPRPLDFDDLSDFLKTLIGQGLLVPEKDAPPALTAHPTTLTAWLHLTDRCNLRCAYCYLPHHKADMTLETGQAAIAAAFRSALAHRYRRVKLKYAGGEAMLRFPLITRLHRYAQALAEQYRLDLEGVILSNGTLLKPDIINAMQTLGLGLMISLDGLGRFHDRQRSYVGGRGTAVEVVRAVQLAMQHGLAPHISITVTGRNAQGLPALMAWVLERQLSFSLNFYRENDLSGAQTDLKLEETAIIAGLLAAYKTIEANLPRRSLLASLVDRANLAAPHLKTCGVGHSYLVFDPQGGVARCQMHLGRSVTTTQAADSLALLRAGADGVQNISVEEKEGCRDCLWRYWCAGGCPLTTYRATGRYDVKSPHCSIYQALYPEVIRLEGLRLLKGTD